MPDDQTVNATPAIGVTPPPPSKAASSEGKAKAGASNTVTIACKLPAGLEVTHKGQTVKLNGWHVPGAVSGYGMTHNVDADWFADFSATHAEYPPIERGMIFANATPDGARDQAIERTGNVASGFEAVNPDKPGPGLERAATPST
jgi:hypothetical protein